MKEYMNELKQRLVLENTPLSFSVSQEDVNSVSNFCRPLIPDDMMDYFNMINGTGGQYDESFICWYSLADFQPLERKFEDWQGIPDYRGIVASMADRNEYFAFADYLYHSLTYAIQLSEKIGNNGRIFAIGGNDPIQLADSFSDFVKLYIDNSAKLYS